MIIVEGPDGSGKTTLVHHLASKYGIPIADKVVASDTNPIYRDLRAWTETNLKHGLQWTLFDRHRLISEPIYAAAMGRKPHDGFDDLGWLTGRMIDYTRIRPFIVYCLPPYDILKANLEDDLENEVIQPYIPVIYNLYLAMAAGDVARGQAVLFNYSADPAFERVDMLFELWQRQNQSRLIRLPKWNGLVKD